MIKKAASAVSQIVLPAVNSPLLRNPPKFIGGPSRRPHVQQWAPAWFYSALAWLGQTYYDAGNVRQSFNQYMIGADVDPYARLGSTRLFMIRRTSENFTLTMAADVNSLAPSTGGASYAISDAGITQMYIDLASSSIFPAVKHCFIPGRIGPDLNPRENVDIRSINGMESGYDPGTGLRVVALGSAVTQAVPLSQFMATHNEQVYDDAPTIVPFVTALVYDVTQYNKLGAMTFTLPVFYTRDQVSPGQYYVSKIGTSAQLNGLTTEFGQTAVFPGGPGYIDADAIALKEGLGTILDAQDHAFFTYNFDTAKAFSIEALGAKVQLGVMSLTYSSASPLSVFSQQRLIGFYRDNNWSSCMGMPIYDYGSANADFASASSALQSPITVYDPTHPFLNGGSLQNVLRKLAGASYLYQPDRLLSILDSAIAAKSAESGAGLSVTTAALAFNMSSTSGAPLLDELSVPVLATVTTTLHPIRIPPRETVALTTTAGLAAASPSMVPAKAAASATPSASAAGVPQQSAISATGSAINTVVNSTVGAIKAGQSILIGGHGPVRNPPSPVTLQIGLNAFIPREALSATGIVNLEVGTPFPEQSLGDGAAFEAATAGTIVNLMDKGSVKPSYPPYDLSIANAGVTFEPGLSYVLSLSGKTLTVRRPDGSTVAADVNQSPAGDAGHTFVGAMIFSAAMTTVRLYPKLQLALAAPAVGTHGVLQGAQYGVRLVIGDGHCTYDIIDATQSAVDSDIIAPIPVPTDGSTPQQNDVYFGSFTGGAGQMTVWSVPVFLAVSPALLPGAGFNGTMVLDAQTSGTPSYQLQIADSSLFVYSNINVDSSAIGSVSGNNVYLAGAVINSTPDDASSKAFAPCKMLLGLVRQVQMGTELRYVFIPEDDSVVIGGIRYLLSVINLDTLASDPNARPYPPVFWPQARYWQFANRHNPYVDVGYEGATQAERIASAQADTARIGLQTAQSQEPMHMFLDTNNEVMTVWPIFGFPYASSSESVDQGQLKAITETILGILGTTFPAAAPAAAPDKLDVERVSVPDLLKQNNPYTSDAATAAVSNPTGSTAIAPATIVPLLKGLPITNMNSGTVASAPVAGLRARQSQLSHQGQLASADVALAKSMAPGAAVMQAGDAVAVKKASTYSRHQYQSIFGFSVYNPATGEAYLIELVEADLGLPDRLPNPTTNADYDPYYVRVVFLNTLTCYNMSIIVPSIAYDQYGHFARQATPYQNVLSKTDEPGIGYLHSLYDQANNFDNLDFTPYGYSDDATVAYSARYLFTNIPYSTKQTGNFNPISLFGNFVETYQFAASTRAARKSGSSFKPSQIVYGHYAVPPRYFVCRRKNWNADCHLMQATNPAGSAVYLAFGGGDLIPFRLDASFDVDKRLPAHMYKLTHTFADRTYESAKPISIGNKPYFVAVSTDGGTTQYTNFSINSTAGTTDLQIGANQPLAFPTECYVVGQASTTLTSISSINSLVPGNLTDTGGFLNADMFGNVAGQEFQLIPYNNLVYLIRAVANAPGLGAVGGLGVTSGLLIDTYVPSTNGNLVLAQGARHKRSGLSFFGSTYTPTTMVDTLDTLDYTSITGQTFYVPTIFIPIPELDAAKNFVADLSNFLGQQIWTFIYPEITAQAGATVNGVAYPNGFNLDVEGKPVLSLQKLHFVYDPLAVIFTPNDLAHKYPLQPKQQILALTNGQIREGICWRSANVQDQRNPPTNICAQQILPSGWGMDRPNIVYSSHNRPVFTATAANYMGMSVNSFLSVSGTVYNIEEAAMPADQTASSFISAVSSTANMLVGVLFDYDNNDLGTLGTYDPTLSTKGIVFINGYLGASGYNFSSPDHFDVNDILPSQLPLLEQIAGTMGEGWDVAFYNTDISLPRQFWSLAYDGYTAPGLPNYIANVPPSVVDPTFSNRTRSLILSLQNQVRPDQLGLMDTYSSVVSANLHLQNGVTGTVFLSKKADRDVASVGTNPPPPGSTSYPLYGLPTKYDFFIFSRDHYWTLKGAAFELIDQGYAMCLVDDGSGTGTKVASYYIDTDGNYYELYSYALYSPDGGIIESGSFTLRVTLGSPANLGATPMIPETPNNVNPQDLVAQINKTSNLIYAAFGPASPGQPPAFIPIQAIGASPGSIQAGPIIGAPGFNGYNLNVMGANRQPVQISQIYSGAVTYPIAGSTTVVPMNAKTGKAVPFYGSLSHGLDKQVPAGPLESADMSAYIPRPTVPAGPTTGLFGGNGLGALIGKPFSCAFQGSGAIPPAVAGNPTPGTTMKGDDGVFYTFNAVSNSIVDSSGKSGTPAGGQYFIDATDPQNPVTGVVTLPKFTLNGNTYTVNMSTTLADGVTSRYSLVVGGKSYLFGPGNSQVTVDRTIFTFNPMKGGIYTVTYAAVDSPTGSQAPAPITLTPFSIAAGGLVATIDVFNLPAGLTDMILGVAGRQYTYDPVHATVTVSAGANSNVVPLQTGLTFTSNSGFGYVIGFAKGQYTANSTAMVPYAASTTGSPATYALLTAPQMFTQGGNFYTFNQDPTGTYQSVTGNGQTYPVNPYQFSLNGTVYIINTNVQPNTVVGGGNVYTMSAGNTQFLLNGVQYTIALKQNSLNGATVSGQFNIAQGNVVVVENYVYQLDTPNGQIVGNGTTYPLTTSGFTYTVSSSDRSFSVTTEPNAVTVTIGNIDYAINNTTVVGDEVIYPILAYRSFVDGTTTYNIGFDGTVSTAPPLTLSGSAPYVRSTFSDGATTYTVNDQAAFNGSAYFLQSGTPAQFTAAGVTYTLRTDGVSIVAGASKTYIVNAGGPPSPNQFAFGTQMIHFGRPGDLAAFDGKHYYAIANGAFTDTNTGLTFALSGNTAVNAGNSYEIFSNLGQGSYFEVPGGTTYYINIAVADTGTASGDIFNVFPINAGQFTIPLAYTVTVAGSVATVSGFTFAAPTVAATLTASGGMLTGGYFTDPVTKITYTCVVAPGSVNFVDSNNVVYPYPSPSAANAFVATVVVATGVNLAVDNEATPAIFPILNNQFIAGPATYTINVPVAYQNAASGPYWPMVNGRFIVPRVSPLSSIAYTAKGGSVTKGYVISVDDEFSADGNVTYTIDAVNVVRASNQGNLSGAVPNQTLTVGSQTYALNSSTSLATTTPAGLLYNTGSKQFTVTSGNVAVTYTVGAGTVADNRHPSNTFPSTLSGTTLTFKDSINGITFTFDDSGNNQISAGYLYTNGFFIDTISGVTYYTDVPDNRVESISYLPQSTQYAFVPADGKTYLIHYSNVNVVFPVISGKNVNAGVATVGSDTFAVEVDQVVPVGGGPGIPVNPNSFEINGNLYSIVGTPVGANYSSCQVVGAGIAPMAFISANTFKLNDPAVTYTLQLGADNLPTAVVAAYAVRPSRDLITVNDDVYIVTYNTVSTGSLLGQGQASIPITNSSFTLTNPFDSTKAKFIFADMNIYDAASVVGQFGVYASPTFFMGSATYTLDTVNLLVTDNNKRPYPLLPNPAMFSINGFNYVIDSNRVPHAIVGNNNVSPLSTDVTVESGHPIEHSTFTLNGLIYKYTEDASGNLLTITGTKSYMVAQPALTFKLDSSLLFTIVTTPPGPGNYAGTTVPIGTITAGALTLNLYAGTPQSGGADFFMYKNVMYTLVKSGGLYEAVQKSYTVYLSQPTPSQQQLAVFNLGGTTYMVTDGTTSGAPTPAGINPGTTWAATSTANVETQFGLVYGMTAQPINVTQSGTGVFQFQVTDAGGNNTLYDIVYTAGGNANMVKVDVPTLLPAFMQSAQFNFIASNPLTFETGGYNAFTTFVKETNTPDESFAAAYRTPVVSFDPAIDTLITSQGDFSVEFWHSLPLFEVNGYHPLTYAASTQTPLVYFVDIDFEDSSDVFVQINNSVLQATATPPVFSSGWRHFALTYAQPYVMLCRGAGFEVKQGSNYNFNRDFSIAMTFSASDASTQQGLLYKGTGSDITSPQLSMSYRVEVNQGAVTLAFTDGNSTLSPTFTGQAVIEAGKFYQVIIVKKTDTPAGNTDNPDPYAAPFDASDLGPAASGGANLNSSGSGAITISNITPAGTGATTKSAKFLQNIQTPATKSYSVTIAVRLVFDDGTYGSWQSATTSQTVANDAGLLVNPTGSAHLLFGSAYSDSGAATPLGDPATNQVGNIRNVYLFNGAINPTGISTSSGLVEVADASANDLLKAGLVGHWTARYDPNGVINNPFDQTAVAISTNASQASLVPLRGREFEGASLFLNGTSIPLRLISGASAPSSLTGYGGGFSYLNFNAGLYKLQEISMWRMPRQPYQVIDDMFGRLIPSNEPSLILYLGGSFPAQAIAPPIVPLNKYIDNIAVANQVQSLPLNFFPASLDLSGSPAIGRCGPLITPNLYTPPGVALTVCDTVPGLTTYSVTINNVSTSLAGEINEAYVYIKNHVLTLYAGKKVGDLVLTWVSQEQGDVQLIGYAEGAPPCPMANLTNKSSYAGATSVTFTAPTSVSVKYQKGDDFSDETKWDYGDNFGIKFGIGIDIAPIGFGATLDKASTLAFNLTFGSAGSSASSSGDGWQFTASEKLDESNKYTVKMQGTLAPYTGDQFMASINALTTPSTTAGNPSSKTAILPNPNLGGFTSSNPPGQLPKTAPTEEKFGSRVYVPSPYGQAFVTSQTLDVYQQTLVQSNTVYGFVRIPNSQIPRDLNIVSFRMSSKYLRPGCLDGVIGYVYNPATLPTGAQTYTTSTGQMQVLYDKNFSLGQVGHDASYMRIVEAYKLKKQIDQQAFNAMALYQSAYNASGGGDPSDSRLTPGLDFYNEYLWSSKGGTQEVKHTYTTTYDEVYTTTTVNTTVANIAFNVKLNATAITVIDAKLGWTETIKDTVKYSYNTTGTSSFDITASFDGIETDTQMRYASSNDAHFVMNFNSMFNPNNQSGLNLVAGSDGLVYNIVPSVSSGAGLPVSDNIDDSQTYMQPQPAYTSGNADGLTGTLEPYDRPGKTKLFRTYAFFLQPTKENADNFWNTVVDPVWLANSTEADADAIRSAQAHSSVPWRLLYRVTYSERFLPPVSNVSMTVPQITPLMAVPVLNPASDFLFRRVGTLPRPALNPNNDIEANIVLAAPTASGLSAGTVPQTGPSVGLAILPNNVIPFDLVKNAATIANWGDSANAKLLTQLITSALGQNTVLMSARALPGSVKVTDVLDPASGGPLYTIYTDPNGQTVNVPINSSVTVYQDVNGNPIQYYDGKTFHSLQADYIASADGSIMYYIEPPSTYDQTSFDLLGDYDLFGHPGDQWRYYLVSGFSANMTSEATVSGSGPFLSSSGATPYTGFSIAPSQHSGSGQRQVQGYVLVQGVLQWPHLNTNAETFADVLIYKSMSLLDTFPIGDPEVLIAFMKKQYPGAPFVANDEINLVFARNIISYFNAAQQTLIPQ